MGVERMTPGLEPTTPSDFDVIQATNIGRDVISAWLNDSVKSAGTKRVYLSHLNSWAKSYGVSTELAVGALLSADRRVAITSINLHRVMLEEAGLTPSTQHGRLTALRSIIAFAHKIDLIAWRLTTEDVRSPPVVPYKDTRGPSMGVVVQMVQAAKHMSHFDGLAERNEIIIRLAGFRGLRNYEITGLDEVNYEPPRSPGGRGVIWVLEKGGKEREQISLSRADTMAMARWVDKRRAILASGVRDNTPAMFFGLNPAGATSPRLTEETVRRVVKKAAELAGVDPKSVWVHALRHSAITYLLDRGIGIRETQRFSRHVKPETLIRYDDNRKDIGGVVADALQDAVEQEFSPQQRTDNERT
jgi:integrase/recombinase XerC